MNTLEEINRLEVKVLMDNMSNPFTQSHPNLGWHIL